MEKQMEQEILKKENSKGSFYPFSELPFPKAKNILDELIEESRKEIFQQKNNKNEQKN
jgi:hypothetical protein